MLEHSNVGATARSLPTGTVAFLFTDIEGSTQRWETHRASMARAIERHDALLQEAITAHDGYVFKRMGDAFCAAFRTAPEAIAAACDAQRALSKEDFSAVDGLKVRMAVHVGDAEERDGDYLGPSVNRVARLLTVGHGGQVLVSGAAGDLAQGEMPPRTALRDLGAHRLKDLARREQIYQLVAIDLQQDFPPLRSLDAFANNLPLQLTSFIGREDEVETVKRLLETHRLTTLVGAAGVGKTRLALHVGADLLHRYEDGVWLIELAPISDGTLIVNELAAIFGVESMGNRPLIDTLLAVLGRKRALVIVDNCEHVVETVAVVIDRVLHTCSGIRVLATSREALKVSGEMVHRVASLTEEAAVALFADRANAAVESFRLTDSNKAAVAGICRRLDGIALAIELAAARIRVMDVNELLSHLDQRFRILTGGSRTALPRQQTMRALIDWSYDLLTSEERTLLRRVSVFAGGWTFDAATSICADERIQRWDILDHLTSLVDKSLVVAEIDEAGARSSVRYRLLESTRQYAAEKLSASGEEDHLRGRHAAFFAELAERTAAEWGRTPDEGWLPALSAETDNFRAALEWALLEKRDIETGSALAGTLFLFWRQRSMMFEGLRYIDAALGHENDLSARTAALLWLSKGAGAHTAALPRQIVRDAAARAKQLYKSLGDRFGTMCAQMEYGDVATLLGQPDEVAPELAEAFAFFNDNGQPRWADYALATLARNDATRGDYDSARDKLARVLTNARRYGDERLISVSISNLAEYEFAAGNVDRAIAVGRESVDRERRRDDTIALTYTLANLCSYLVAKKQFDEAHPLANEALRRAHDAQSGVLVACALNGLAAIAAHRKKFQDAASVLGYADNWFKRQPRETTEQRIYEFAISILHGALTEEDLMRALQAGAAMSEEQAIALALEI